MNVLNLESIREVLVHDFKVHIQKKQPNRTRFYKYLALEGRDVFVFTVAVKNGKQGQVAKEVVRASVDDPFVYVRDMAFLNLAGYSVDWSQEKLGPDRCWGHIKGAWSSAVYERNSGLWKLDRDVINPEILLQSERFKWCAWSPACGDILDYLKAYVKHPRIELLAKTEAARFSTKLGFVRLLENDKNMLRFFMENIKTINRNRYGVDVIRASYFKGISFDRAALNIACRREFKGYQLPRELDAVRCLDYITSAKSYKQEYCTYIRNCSRLGMDLADTKNTFPKSFKRRRLIVADAVAELDRQQRAELAVKQDQELIKVCKKLTRYERKCGQFMLVLPRKSLDFVREGKRLHNCLGDGHYIAKMVRGETVIAFVRRSNKPSASYAAVEYSPKQRKVLQCYLAKNQRPPQPVLKFVNSVFPARRCA